VNARFTLDDVTLGYDESVISDSLSLSVPAGEFSVIVGPNACGKSTLLKALARILKPMSGTITLNGQALESFKAKEAARTVGLLPQNAIAPEKMLVRDLVAKGRAPHQSLLKQWSLTDAQAVRRAMELTNTLELADSAVDELSGGQRQRVWIAMVLAQDTETILLDEPTTFLDLKHQIEVLELCKKLHREEGRTIVAVLHDLNQAARYATHLIAMKKGAVMAQGKPEEVVTQENIEVIFDLQSEIISDPITHTPMVIPYGS
jgi:iron complex transport system ATP-binding protein